ncbi:hypothetical protein ON010_g15835 [Phytophthora cinnamomi]|nr:hypothetical protein ON010_g15835 [Phytophthora cinnamomi]
MSLRVILFLEHGENEAVAEADAVRMYRLGMPIDWQVEVNRISRIWDLESIETQFELIERNEHDDAILRNGRPKRNAPKQQQGSNRNNGTRRQPADPRHHQNSTRVAGDKYCDYCKKNNHNDDHCFRNPASPAFRPRGGNNYPGRRTRGPSAMAAMQTQMTEMAAMVTAIKSGRTKSSPRCASIVLVARTRWPRWAARQAEEPCNVIKTLGWRLNSSWASTGCQRCWTLDAPGLQWTGKRRSWLTSTSNCGVETRNSATMMARLGGPPIAQPPCLR